MKVPGAPHLLGGATCGVFIAGGTSFLPKSSMEVPSMRHFKSQVLASALCVMFPLVTVSVASAQMTRVAKLAVREVVSVSIDHDRAAALA